MNLLKLFCDVDDFCIKFVKRCVVNAGINYKHQAKNITCLFYYFRLNNT